MTPALAAEISALLLVGMCGGDKLAECEHCQRRLRAVEQVRALVPQPQPEAPR